MRSNRGFTLVEIAVVLVVVGGLFTILIGISASLISQQRYQTTRSRLSNIDNALVLYVSVNKRLPCPADGTQSSSTGGDEAASLAGSTRTCTSNQQNGVVPWRALGLAETDIEDGWGGRITYRVGPDLVHANSMDFSNCDPAGGAAAASVIGSSYCSSACAASTYATTCTSPANALTSTTAGRGVVVKNVAGTVIMDPRGSDTSCAGANGVSTGAAYALVSHGAEGGGAYGPEGTMLGSSTAAGTMEASNYANLAYTLPTCSGASTSFVVDDTLNAVASTAHFDDLVVRPNILSVVSRAQLGPRVKN